MLSWFRNILNKQASKAAIQTLQKEEKLSVRQQGYRLYEELVKYKDRGFDPAIGFAITIQVPVDNIEKLIHLLRQFNQLLADQQTLPRERFYFDLKHISLESFFISDKKLYISQHKIADYLTEVKRLYDHTQAGEVAQYGVDEHNYRMLTKTFVSLKNLNEGLLEAYLFSPSGN